MSNQPANTGRRFPLGLAMAGIAATGLGLALSAGNVRWGAAPVVGDGLGLAWEYVNVALVWTWFLVWPALGLGRERLGRAELGWDFAVLAAGAVPALCVAGFLGGAQARELWAMIALQAGFALFAMGAMAWRARVGAGVIGGILAAAGAMLPVAGYLWAEFFPAARQGWRMIIPVVATARTAGEGLGVMGYWVAGGFGLAGLTLWLTAPAGKEEPVENSAPGRRSP